MNQDIRKDLHVMTTTLMDSVDVLIAQNANKELVTLLERALNIGNMSILYLDSLDEMTIKNALATVGLAQRIIEAQDEMSQDIMCTDLRKIVESVENLFRSKHFLLDGTEEKMMVA